MKKSKDLIKRLIESRRILQDPYAYLDGNGDFDGQDMCNQISDSRRLLQNQYAHMNPTGGFDAITSILKIETAQSIVNNANPRSKEHRYAWIERKARDLQLNLWKHRHQLWPEDAPIDPVKLLEPSIAIQYIGYDFEQAEFLGDFGGTGSYSEIAGTIDQAVKRISISNRLPVNTHRFTAAHELGHAILHQGLVMHRDRPVDGSRRSDVPREPKEIEADKFAVYFLMPERLVKERFHHIFGKSCPFILTDDTAFALGSFNSANLIERCKSLRDLARVLAKAEYYNGRNIVSLATQFGVSVETMAIRIEELDLVEV
jgi:Zn-dependent peptidase ImmA (M78 family)